jgi:ubiquinone/menaquinone biosynthesis C-methylase UbiE
LLGSEHHPKQKLVDERFDGESTYWRDVYKRKDIFGFIYRQRQTVALNFIEELSLPKTARVLEIGCGAGFMSVALARGEFIVKAVDHSSVMVELTQLHANRAGMDNQIHTGIEDVHKLTFEDCSFDLVVALGVIAWLHDLRKALIEITRVLAPGGYAVLNMYSRNRANAWIDILTLLRGMVQERLEKTGLRSPPQPNVARGHSYSIKEFNHYLYEAGLTNMKDTSIGFGPFKLFNHNIFSDRMGVKVHQKLQTYADNGYPILRLLGSQYVVLARKRKQQGPKNC